MSNILRTTGQTLVQQSPEGLETLDNPTGKLEGEDVLQVNGEPLVLRELDLEGDENHVDTMPRHQVHVDLRELVDVPGEMHVDDHDQVGGHDHPPQLQQQVNERLMTFDTLAQNIGHRPHEDRLCGLWKMSTTYKAVEAGLNEVNRLLGGATLGTIARDPVQAGQLRDELNDLVANVDRYIEKNTSWRGNPNAKAQAMQEMVAQARLALALLDDPDSATLPPDLTLAQGISIKKCGIQLSDCDFTTFTDANLNRALSQDNFGAGNANTVSKLVYAGDQTKIFKPEPEVDRNPLLAQRTLGININAPHYGERNIASRSVDQALGGDTIVGSRMVMHDGQIGLLMDKATGHMPSERLKIPVTEPQQRYIDGVMLNAPSEEVGLQRCKSAEFVRVNGAWMKIEPRYENPFGGIPPTPQLRASIQQQLCRMEWADALTGQFDRHGQNYLLDFDRNTGTATVKGIDNDLAFGKDLHTIPGPGPDPVTGYNGIGLPQLIDSATYDRIHNMDFDRDLLPGLEGRLTPEEISATRDRFTILQNHAETLHGEGKVVNNWLGWRLNGQSATQFLSSQPVANSYYKRDIHDFI